MENQEHKEDQNTETFLQPSEKKKRFPYFPIIAILFAVAVLFFAAHQEVYDGEEGDTHTDGDAIAEEQVNGEVVDDVVVDMDGLTATDFEGAEKAEEIINGTQGKVEGPAYEKIVSSVVPSADLEDIVYFATMAYDEAVNETFVGVYQYHTVTYQWQRLYKYTHTGTEELGPAYLHVLGLADQNLVLFVDRMGREAETCESLWLVGQTEVYQLKTLSLESPLDGLQDFTPSEELLEEERAHVAECLGEDEE